MVTDVTEQYNGTRHVLIYHLVLRAQRRNVTGIIRIMFIGPPDNRTIKPSTDIRKKKTDPVIFIKKTLFTVVHGRNALCAVKPRSMSMFGVFDH